MVYPYVLTKFQNIACHVLRAIHSQFQVLGYQSCPGYMEKQEQPHV